MSNMFFKKPYEISLWKDVLCFRVDYFNEEGKVVDTKIYEGSLKNFVNPTNVSVNVTQFYKEKKIGVIGSDTMDSPIRAFRPKLETNVNGSSQLTFTLFHRYYDTDDNQYYDNPYIKLMVNERKIKLRYGAPGPECQWFDFVIKDIEESSDEKGFVYTAKNLFINELSKSGFNLEFDPKLENNQGSVNFLAEKILEGSDWQLYPDNQVLLRQTLNEPLYAIRLNQDITITDMLTGTTELAKAHETIYGFYNSVNTKDKFFQLLYVKPKNGKQLYLTDEDNVINNSPNYFIDNTTYAGEKPSFAATMNVSEYYRGKRLVRKSSPKYDALLDRYVDVYTDGTKEVYGYIDRKYLSSATVNELATNSKDFDSFVGWRTSGTSSVEGIVQPQKNLITLPDIYKVYNAEKYKSFLQIVFTDKNQMVFNSGISDHRSYIKSFSLGEKYVLRLQYGAPGDSDIVPTEVNLKVKVCSYSYSNGICTLEDTYFDFSLSGDKNKGQQGIAECKKALTYNELLSQKIGIFITTDTINVPICIEELSFFKYALDKNGKMCIPGQDIEGYVQKEYFYYYPDISIKKKEDIVYIYRGFEPSPNYTLIYNDKGNNKFEKIRSIKDSESNRFNLIQKLCEIFECWADFTIEHNPQTGEILTEQTYQKADIDAFEPGKGYFILQNGEYLPVPSTSAFDKNQTYYTTSYRQKKWISFREYIGNDNHIGFKYGINLKTIRRNLDSNGIISKIIVKNNSNEHAKDKFCTISRASENPSGENYIYDFSHYVNQGLIGFNEVNNDLYSEHSGYIGYYKKLHRMNINRDAWITESSELLTEISNQKSAITTHEAAVNAAEEERAKKKGSIKATTSYTYEQMIGSAPATGDKIESWRKIDAIKADCASVARLDHVIEDNKSKLEMARFDLAKAETREKELEKKLKELLKKKVTLEKIFQEKYSRFIQEGSWISEDYIDDNLYFLDAQSTLHTSSQPKVTYTIEVLELSRLPGYENFVFNLGDKTFIEDTEFFGWTFKNNLRTPRKEEIVVTQIIYSLDNPEENVVKVQNYKTQFEDLFQRITATTQTVEYSKGQYAKGSSILTEDGKIKIDTLQNSISNNSVIIKNADNQSVIWDSSGITTSSLTNPNEVVRIVSGGVFISDDGGLTWHTGISAQGINASYITSGQIDTSIIRIMNGAFPSFRWDQTGLNAFHFEVNPKTGLGENFDFGKFVRFDQYGLYGITKYPNFDPTVKDEDGVGEDKIWKNADFAFTWKGFKIKSNHTVGGLGGHIAITSEDDFVVYNEDNIDQVKIGLLDITEGPQRKISGVYGLRLKDGAGNVVLENSTDGKVWIKDSITIGQNSSSVRIGYLPEVNGMGIHEVIHAGKDDSNLKFVVYENGYIEATGGKIGNMTINEITDTVANTKGIKIQSLSGFGFKVNSQEEATPATLKLALKFTGIDNPTIANIVWYGSQDFSKWEMLSQGKENLDFSYIDNFQRFLEGVYYIKVSYNNDEYVDYCTLNLNRDGTAPLSIVIESSNGDTFINHDVSSVMTARVYRGNEEVTNQFTKEQFSWIKFDKDGIKDQKWTTEHQNYGNKVTITHIDIDGRAQFECEIELKGGK